MSDSVFQHFSAVGMFDALTNTIVETRNIIYFSTEKGRLNGGEYTTQ